MRQIEAFLTNRAATTTLACSFKRSGCIIQPGSFERNGCIIQPGSFERNGCIIRAGSLERSGCHQLGRVLLMPKQSDAIKRPVPMMHHPRCSHHKAPRPLSNNLFHQKCHQKNRPHFTSDDVFQLSGCIIQSGLFERSGCHQLGRVLLMPKQSDAIKRPVPMMHHPCRCYHKAPRPLHPSVKTNQPITKTNKLTTYQ